MGPWTGVTPTTAKADGKGAARNSFGQSPNPYYIGIPKTTSNGLYLIDVAGTYCTANLTNCPFDPTAQDLSPSVKIYYNNGNWHDALAQTILLSPALGSAVNPANYCDTIALQTMAFINRGSVDDFAVQVTRTAKSLRPLCKNAKGKVQPDEAFQTDFTMTVTDLLTF
jgi:hypothetical protein